MEIKTLGMGLMVAAVAFPIAGMAWFGKGAIKPSNPNIIEAASYAMVKELSEKKPQRKAIQEIVKKQVDELTVIQANLERDIDSKIDELKKSSQLSEGGLWSTVPLKKQKTFKKGVALCNEIDRLIESWMVTVTEIAYLEIMTTTETLNALAKRATAALARGVNKNDGKILQQIEYVKMIDQTAPKTP